MEKTDQLVVKFHNSVGAVEGVLIKGTVGAKVLFMKLDERAKNETDKTRVAVAMAAMGIELRFNFAGRRSGG
jgi:hypothetical protein